MFLAGESILIRTVLWGRVRYAQPATVVVDDPGDALMWFRPAGTPMKVPAAHLTTGEERIRLSREECQTGRWVHHDACGRREKDREDYDERMWNGLISPAEARSVEAALVAARSAVAAQSPPFDNRWLDWRPNPSWPVPSLPPNWYVT